MAARDFQFGVAAAPKHHYERVGMFDWYEPEPVLRCPRCGSDVIAPWQGKDGPNGLFLWKQGRSVPVEHRVDDEVHWKGEDLRRFSLPETFDIYTDCEHGHYVVAAGRCESGTWKETVEATAYESMSEYVETERRRR